MSHGASGTSPRVVGNQAPRTVPFISPRLRGEHRPPSADVLHDEERRRDASALERSEAGEGDSRQSTERESPPPPHPNPLPASGERERTVLAARCSRPLLRILLAHLLEECGGLDAPLLLELDQLAGAMPVLQRRRHE